MRLAGQQGITKDEPVIPLGDSVPSRHFPFVTYTLILLNTIVFLFELALGPHLNEFIMLFGVVPARLAQFHQYPLVLLTLVTSQFLHGGWWHIIGNMLYLWIFGDNVEDLMGPGRYLLFYLFAGCVAGIAQSALSPGSWVPSIGASGAIAGVLGAYLYYYPKGWVHVGIFVFITILVVDVPAYLLLGFWFISQFFNGIAAIGHAAMGSGGIAWWAHVGGFLTGLILAAPLRKREPYPRTFRA